MPPENALGNRPATTVLVVEDDPHVRDTIRRTLVAHAYSVLVPATPTEAVAIVENASRVIDLLITDLEIPEMHGAALANDLKARRSAMAVLCMSGYVDAMRDQVIPGAHYLATPFSVSALARAVRDVLGVPAQ